MSKCHITNLNLSEVEVNHFCVYGDVCNWSKNVEYVKKENLFTLKSLSPKIKTLLYN